MERERPCLTEDKSLANDEDGSNDEICTEFAHMQDVIIDSPGVGDGRSRSKCAVHPAHSSMSVPSLLAQLRE